MVSRDIANIRTWLDLALTTKGGLSRAELTVLLRSLANVHAQAMALENAQVPKRQRITQKHLRGNVKLLPVAPRREALLP